MLSLLGSPAWLALALALARPRALRGLLSVPENDALWLTFCAWGQRVSCSLPGAWLCICRSGLVFRLSGPCCASVRSFHRLRAGAGERLPTRTMVLPVVPFISADCCLTRFEGILLGAYGFKTIALS